MRFLTFLARRFIAGETAEDAISALKELNKMGMSATLDILGENVTNQAKAIRAADSYIELLEIIDKNNIDSNISIKLTQMGLDISDQFCFENVSRILKRAKSLGNFVRIDMEGSQYTERTLELVYRWHEEYGNVGAVIQAYLYRSENDINELNKKKIKVRLCKGAYKEPKDVAFQSKDDVNSNFIKLSGMLLNGGVYPAIASHDGSMVKSTIQQAKNLGRDKDDFEFQMLYGVNRSAQRELVNQGYKMRIYTPFGTHWLPYFLRRLRERRENVLFIARHLFKD